MAREKYQTLTQSMFYILLALEVECCGAEIVYRVGVITQNRIQIGPGTLYALLGDFLKEELIRETFPDGRRRRYIITSKGNQLLQDEFTRIRQQVEDYQAYHNKE